MRIGADGSLRVLPTRDLGVSLTIAAVYSQGRWSNHAPHPPGRRSGRGGARWLPMRRLQFGERFLGEAESEHAGRRRHLVFRQLEHLRTQRDIERLGVFRYRAGIGERIDE